MTLQTKKYYLSIIALFIFLLLLNIFLPPQSDDIDVMSNPNGLAAALNSYKGWNARIGELLYTGFVGSMNETLFNIINAFIGTIFIVLNFVLIFGRFPKNGNDFVIIALILFNLLYFSAFGSNFLWVAGSLNYLWGLFLVALLWIPYRLFYQSNTTNLINEVMNLFKGTFIVLFLILSFFAGMASEQAGAVSIIIHFVLIVYIFIYKKFFYKKKMIDNISLSSLLFPAPSHRILDNGFPLWYKLGIILFILGFCVLYFSPGHEARVTMYKGLYHYLSLRDFLALDFGAKMDRIILTLQNSHSLMLNLLSLSMFSTLYLSFRFIKSRVIYITFLFVILYLLYLQNNVFLSHLIIICVCIRFLYSRTFQAIFGIYLIYLLIALSTFQITLLPGRARLIDVLLLSSIFCILFKYFSLNSIFKKYASRIVLVFVVVYGTFVAVEYARFNHRWNVMIEDIQKEKQKGNLDIVYKNIFISHYKNFGDWNNPTDLFFEQPNMHYAEYFGVNSFRVDEFYVFIKRF